MFRKILYMFEIAKIFRSCLFLFLQSVLDALDKTAQEVAESCTHLMPIPDKTTVMASSATEFQWLTGWF